MSLVPIESKIRIFSIVPPGASLVGVYPQYLFRVDRFHLPVAPDLFIALGGILVPCDGHVHRNHSPCRTLCVGAFFAFDIRNHAAAPRQLELTVSGKAIDAPEESAPFVMLGTFTMEAEDSPNEDG